MTISNKKVVKGVFWSVLENLGGLIFKFILGIMLARILMPEDFGIFGIVMVFMDISNELVQGGFGQAFIQKKNTTKEDAATVFYFNLLVSVVIYTGLWISAPLIASFYNQPELIDIIRVMAVVVVIDALRVIKLASLMKEINFKKKTVVMLISILIAGIISIILALKGFGIWALICNTLLSRLFNTIGLWIKSERIPLKNFSYTSLKTLFSFGSWLLISSVISKLFQNINTLFIGRYFSPAILGFYTRSNQYKNMAVGQIFTAINTVTFPVFSLMQDNKEQLRSAMKKFSQQVLLIILPLILTLLVVAKPFIILLLTEKWSPMIPFLQLFCIIGAIFPINAINTQILVAQGYSKLQFKITIIKVILRIVNLAALFRFGVLYILVGEVFISFVSLIINTYYTKRFLNYGLWDQMKDVKHYYTGGLIAMLSGLTFSLFVDNLYILFVVGILTTAGIFFLYQYIFNKGAFSVLIMLKEKILRNISRERAN